MTDEIPLADRIACVRREIALRERVYPKWVAAGRMKQEAAERELETMRAVLTTVEAVAALGTAAPETPTQRRRWISLARWRHKKRQSEYEILTSTAEAQCATGPINEGDHVTLYQADDGNWYVRKTDEFQDGRFERIDLATPA